MAIVTTDDSHYKAIAETMRELAPVGNLKSSEMANAVYEVYAAGQQDGHEVGLENGVAQGKQEEYDRFWDDYQDNGNRIHYSYAFGGYGWNDETYDPKYPINATEAGAYMFYATQITDTKVPIDIGSTTSNSANRFNKADQLVTIRKLIVEAGAGYSGCFTGCTALENITIEGVIGKNFDISDSPKLTHDSLMSIINHLKDTSSKLTLTIGSENLAKLTDAEKAIATEKGWTLA